MNTINSVNDSRVVGWRYVDQRGYLRAALDRNWLGSEAIPLVPLSLLAEAERRIVDLTTKAHGYMQENENFRAQKLIVDDYINELTTERDALQSRLELVQAKLYAVAGLADRWEKLAARGVSAFTGNNHRLFANELRATLGGESPGNEELK